MPQSYLINTVIVQVFDKYNDCKMVQKFSESITIVLMIVHIIQRTIFVYILIGNIKIGTIKCHVHIVCFVTIVLMIVHIVLSNIILSSIYEKFNFFTGRLHADKIPT